MLTWTLQTSSWDGGIVSDARSCWAPGLGKFVVTKGGVGSTTHEQTSPDGAAWTGTNPATFEGGYGILNLADTGPLFVAGAAGGGNTGIFTSPDAAGWTFRTSPIDGTLGFAVTYSPDLDLWVVGDQHSPHPRVVTAPDPTGTWTLQTNAWGAASGECWGAAWGPAPASLFVICGNSNVGSGPDYDGIQTSPDGVAWTSRTAAGNAMNGGFAYQVIWSTTLSRFIVVGGNRTNTKSIGHSADGLTWTDVPTSPFNGAECLCVIDTGTKLFFGGYTTDSPPKTVWSTSDLVAFTDEGCLIDGQVDSLSYSPALGLLAAIGNRFSDNSFFIATAPLFAPGSIPFFHAHFSGV